MDVFMETERKKTWQYIFNMDKWSVREIIAIVVCDRVHCTGCNAPASYIRKECQIGAAQRLAFLLERSDIFNVKDGENISPHDAVAPRAFIKWALQKSEVIQLPKPMLDWYNRKIPDAQRGSKPKKHVIAAWKEVVEGHVPKRKNYALKKRMPALLRLLDGTPYADLEKEYGYDTLGSMLKRARTKDAPHLMKEYPDLPPLL